MAISYKMLPNFLSADICDKILENIPPPNYDTMPSIDRSVDLPPLNTWYRMEKVPFRIELDLSDEVRQKLNEAIDEDFSVALDRMYVTQYGVGEGCEPHTYPAHHTIIVQINDGFTGGVFTLDDKGPYHRYPIELKKGDAVIFSNTWNLHGVKPVESGVRQALAIWINYDKYKYETE